MKTTCQDFQAFIKPIGPVCNLDCSYCYYLKNRHAYPPDEAFRMPEAVLERAIGQHIEAAAGPEIHFAWHGGEPMLLGLEYFQRLVALQRRHTPAGRVIRNGLQTNGTLLDEDWCSFLAAEGFSVGLSIDGPAALHDRCRRDRDQEPTHGRVIAAYERLSRHKVPVEILCVVSSHNVHRAIEVYEFFRALGIAYLTLLPLVEVQPDRPSGVSERTIGPEAWGEFLCTTFDQWQARDIGRIKVQIFEEATRPAFGQEHTLCVFRETCGRVPVVEHNGDFFSCDHFVDPAHRLGNIMDKGLLDLLEDPRQKAFGQAKLDRLPQYCRDCSVRAMCNGGCPKNRIICTPDGEAGLEYLCRGYKRFFNHCRPFVDQVSTLWRRQKEAQARPLIVPAALKPGRNDPCPCGSGRKFKHCCMR
jgi:uncharacterized protein